MKICIPDIIDEVKSGIIHIVHLVDGKRVSSGTGFMVNGYLVTNYHVISRAPNESKIILRTYDSNPNKPLDGVIELEREDGCFSGKTNKDKIENFILYVEEENKGDYAVYHIPELKERSIKGELYNFSLDIYNKRIGEEILFMGYPFEANRIISHRGFISSFIPSSDSSNGIAKIQIDASVNNGNSGSPLIDPITSRVIGIITRSEKGLSDQFGNIYKNIQDTKKEMESHQQHIRSETDYYLQSLEGLKKQQMNYHISGQPISTTQENIQNLTSAQNIVSSSNTILSNSITKLSRIGDNLTTLAREIERSANVGIGYAFSVEKLILQAELKNLR